MPAERSAELARLPVTIIGRMEAGQTGAKPWATVIDAGGHKIETGRGGFQHF